MKNILKAVIVVGLLVGSPGLLLAQADKDFTEVRVIEKTKTRAFPVRLEEAKKQFEDRISKAKEERVAKACKQAQIKIASVKEKAQSFQARHGEIYQKWITKLTDLSARIAAAGIDTTTLDSYIQELNALVAQNISDLESYVTGLGDVSVVDCEANPAAFYSALQTARATRALVVDDTKELLAYIRSNIKAELQSIKQQLQDNKVSAPAEQSTGQNVDGGTQ